MAGYTNIASQEIFIAEYYADGTPAHQQSIAVTLLHEVLHAALEASGLDRDPEAEERWINALQGPLLVALQDWWLIRRLHNRSEPEIAWKDPTSPSLRQMQDGLNKVLSNLEAVEGGRVAQRKNAARYDVRRE